MFKRKKEEKPFTITQTEMYDIIKSTLKHAEANLIKNAAHIATERVIEHFIDIGLLDEYGKVKK